MEFRGGTYGLSPETKQEFTERGRRPEFAVVRESKVPTFSTIHSSSPSRSCFLIAYRGLECGRGSEARQSKQAFPRRADISNPSPRCEGCIIQGKGRAPL